MRPMDSEALLVRQAEAVRAVAPRTRIFVYRNLVKALPWFGSVREKLLDPRYAGWFLHYRPPPHNYSSPPCTGRRCSQLFHDRDQTPSTDPLADGRCTEQCDCGDGLPCGEYLFDHRNESLREWLVSEQVMGPNALGSAHISGLYLDDEWYDTTQPDPWWGPPEGFCTSGPYGGPSEVYPNCTLDMGLSEEGVRDITAGWRRTRDAAYAAALRSSKWAWQLFEQVGSPPRQPSACAKYFRQACAPDSVVARSATFFSFSGARSPPSLPSPIEDIAAFLLIRGEFAWIGYGWAGCVACNETSEDPSGLCDPAAQARGGYERPPQLDADYGEPLGACEETVPGSSMRFIRPWTRAKAIEFDCNTWTGTVEPARAWAR